MAKHHPRKPRKPPTLGARSGSISGSAESALSMVERLAKEYQAAQRRAERDAARARGRSAAQQSARARRVPTAEDAFLTPQATGEETPGTPAAMPLFPWLAGEDVAEFDRPFVRRAERPLFPWLDEPSSTGSAMPGELPGVDRPGPPGPPNPPWPGEDIASSNLEWYSPTRSIYPPRPRTLEMMYDRQTRILRVVFRDGGTYDYFDVPGSVWYRIRQVRSPGRFLDRNIIGKFEYERVAM